MGQLQRGNRARSLWFVPDWLAKLNKQQPALDRLPIRLNLLGLLVRLAKFSVHRVFLRPLLLRYVMLRLM